MATRPVKRGLLGSGIEVTAAIDQPNEPEVEVKTPAPMPVAPSSLTLAEEDVDRIVAPLRAELRSLRAIVREANDNGWPEDLRRELEAMRATFASRMGSGMNAPSIASLIRPDLCARSEARVVALVGPTGVGKTTTIGKLAARAALVEQRSVALVTLDTYRVGGEEQLRTFADLIGVTVERVDDPRRLARTIQKMIDVGNWDRIYVDTAGRSPRDREAIEVLAEAFAPVDHIEVHLALAASTSPGAIDASLEHHRLVGIDRLLFTKLDEAADLGELVRAPARFGMPVTWLTTGQRVPEDLENANLERLAALAEHGFSTAEAA